MKTNRLVTGIIALLTALVLLTGAVAVPILCRPFYYLHIDLLNLEQVTGLTREEIQSAYDAMLDFCLGGEEFSAGVLPWSESGKSHFQDVRTLFLLDLRVLAVCALLLVAVMVFVRRRNIPGATLLGHGAGFWAGAGLGGVFLVVGALAALDFHRAFVVFHSLFFPGKDNWLFDPETDPIIDILPQDYFMDCAILILAVLILGCAALILWDIFKKRARKS